MEWESIGFFLAAFYNLNILVVSWCLTDNKFHDHDASFFSREQCILVCLWGAAYGTMATEFTNAPYICAVFGVEKVFFFRHWYRSLLTRGLPDPAMAKVIISAPFRWLPHFFQKKYCYQEVVKTKKHTSSGTVSGVGGNSSLFLNVFNCLFNR